MTKLFAVAIFLTPACLKFGNTSSTTFSLLAEEQENSTSWWPNKRQGASIWEIKTQQGAVALFGGTGIYTDETHSFEETLPLADFWIFHKVNTSSSFSVTSEAQSSKPKTVCVPNVEGDSCTEMQWTLIASLGQDNPLANTSRESNVEVSKPQGRTNAQTWTTTHENIDGFLTQQFWLYGGKGYPTPGDEGLVNDMWRLEVPIVEESTDLSVLFSSLRWECFQRFDTIHNTQWLYGMYPNVHQITTKMTAEPCTDHNSSDCGKNSNLPHPGARQDSVTWTFKNNLWLFGGLGYGAPTSGAYDFTNVEGHYGYLNDMWEFDTASFEWTWHGGKTLPHAYGVYTSNDTSQIKLYPGGRAKTNMWISPMPNKVWIFGGYGFVQSGGAGYLNDMWQLNLESLEWSWIGGRETKPNQIGSYYGKSAWPGSRAGAAVIRVPSCTCGLKLFLHGGYGYGKDVGFQGRLQDSWLYDGNTSTWSYVGGTATLNAISSIGDTMSQDLGGRAYAASWRFGPALKTACNSETIQQMSILIFGGGGYNMQSTSQFRNDLWLLHVDLVSTDTILITILIILFIFSVSAIILFYCYCSQSRGWCRTKNYCYQQQLYTRVSEMLY